MEDKSKLQIQYEVIWWLITVVVVVAVMLPIWLNVPDYPFITTNIVFIVVFLTFTRWIFLLKYTWFGWNRNVKLLILFTALPVIVLLSDHLNQFQIYLDDFSIQSFIGHLSNRKQIFISEYIRLEMLFFGSASVIATIVLAFRMMVSIWKVINRGTV